MRRASIAPFRRRIGDLVMPGCAAFDQLQFERKCPTGLRGGRSPNLDVLVSGSTGVVGIESKLSEYLVKHRAAFSPERRGTGTYPLCIARRNNSEPALSVFRRSQAFSGLRVVWRVDRKPKRFFLQNQ